MSFDRQTFPWIWTGLLGVIGLAFTVFGAGSLGGDDVGLGGVVVVLVLLMAGLGSVITVRQPRNRIAWLLHATAVLLLLIGITSIVAEAPVAPTLSTIWDRIAIVVYNVTAVVVAFPVLLILFIFPTGQFPTRRWRWGGWLAGAFTLGILAVALLSEELGKLYNPDGTNWHVTNPLGLIDLDVGEFLNSASVGVTMFLALGGVVAMIVRYRRSDALVRAQVKWVVYGAALAAVALFSISFSNGDGILYSLLVIAALAAIAAAITLAIVKYKLFEIDRLISRTIAYALVVGLLAAMYFALTALIANLLPAQGGLAVAGSTLAVAALFNPLRKRVQGVVDRKFNRPRYEAELVVERLSDVLSEPTSISEITEIWRKTVGSSLQPEAVGIWLSAAATGDGDVAVQ